MVSDEVILLVVWFNCFSSIKAILKVKGWVDKIYIEDQIGKNIQEFYQRDTFTNQSQILPIDIVITGGDYQSFHVLD